MKNQVVAKRYAIGLISIVKKAVEQDTVLDELELFAEAYGSSIELKNLIHTPQFSLEIKESVVGGVIEHLRINEKSGRLIMLLLFNGRINILRQIIEEYQKLILDFQDRAIVKITSPFKISQEQLAVIEESLSNVESKELIFDTVVDKSLIGGLIIQIGNRLYDGSIVGQLKELQSKII
ncbi:MAG: ATP synthase F1 subunit delta [Nitrospinota bacterium]